MLKTPSLSENGGLWKTWNHAHGAPVPQGESGCAWSDCSVWHRWTEPQILSFLAFIKRESQPGSALALEMLPWVRADQPP